MKLAQLNIWQGRLILNVVRFLQKNPFDILCLQEAASSTETRKFGLDNLQTLQRELDLPYLCFAPTMDFQIGSAKVAYGNAILSRIPLTEVKTTFTFGEYCQNASFSSFSLEPRNFQHITLENNGRTINIINHHGHWVPGEKNGDAETERQMSMIADYISTLDSSVIFTGDLNLLPDAPDLKRLNSELNNLCIARNIVTTRNFTAYDPQQVCDYIFVNNKVNVLNFKVHNDVISDHSLIELEFE